MTVWKTHGMRNTSEYSAWVEMKQRCLNPNYKWFHNYGGRGIKVCKRWLTFENFIKDISLKPSKNYSLDRIDNNGNYTPKNCKWSTDIEQSRNRRSTKLSLEKAILIRDLYKTGKFSQSSIAEKFNVSRRNIGMVINRLIWKEL